mmetsp:Transcript_18865/g.49486  ORF Transcript_18865/g.49486 Transcript_18865/m.49486 type:complete len:210 (+) Transcript_18865:255-884(+)
MFPQLGTEMAKVKLSKEKKESEDFAKELVGRELKAANATNAKAFRGSGGSSKIRWYLSKEDSEHHQKVLRLKFEQKKRQFTTPQLEGAFESYLQDRYQSALDKDADRWMALMHLSDVIRHDPVAEGVRLSGGDFAAYELFFRCEPRTHICRARFMIAMRKVGQPPPPPCPHAERTRPCPHTCMLTTTTTTTLRTVHLRSSGSKLLSSTG